VPDAAYAPAVAATEVEPWRPTLEEFRQLAELGALDDLRVELLDGIITRKPPMKPPHLWALAFLNRAILESVPRDYMLLPQGAIWLGEGWVPSPDFALLAPPRQTRWVRSADWVCEIAVTSKRRDRVVKRPAYARHGIPEYWVVLPVEWWMEVHLRPEGGDYRDVQTHTAGTLRAATLPGPAVDLDALWAAEPAE